MSVLSCIFLLLLADLLFQFARKCARIHPINRAYQSERKVFQQRNEGTPNNFKKNIGGSFLALFNITQAKKIVLQSLMTGLAQYW
jgi:hypothetical protein